MSERTADAIRAAIQDHGPITFAEFMDIALYGPDGYYTHPPIGPDGDFVTSPHVHPVFGELLGKAIRELWAGLGGPTPFSIMEVGAGDGTLARQLMDALQDLPIDYLAIDRGSGARLALSQIEGIRTTASMPSDLRPNLLLAHELLDNLAFRRVRGTDNGIEEIRISAEFDRFIEVGAPVDEELIRLAPATLDQGEEAVVCVGAIAFVERVAPMLTHGYALFVDYGAETGTGGLAHGYRSQQLIEDILADPGSTDITAGVDFGAISRVAEARRLTAFPTVTQHDALMSLGFQDWIHSELKSQGDMLNEGEGVEAVRRWGARSRATMLADPAHLGRLRWLVIASHGLPAPSWTLST